MYNTGFLVLGRIACTQCIRCGLLLQMAHVAWSVCLIVCLCVLFTRTCFANTRQNRPKCRLGGWLLWIQRQRTMCQMVSRYPTRRGNLGGLFRPFKVCMTVYKCLHGLAPPYLAELCVPVADVGARRRLRSASRGLLDSPWFNMSNYGRHAFSFAGPRAWNSLPEYLRQASSLSVFKRSLKTYLFK